MRAVGVENGGRECSQQQSVVDSRQRGGFVEGLSVLLSYSTTALISVCDHSYAAQNAVIIPYSAGEEWKREVGAQCWYQVRSEKGIAENDESKHRYILVFSMCFESVAQQYPVQYQQPWYVSMYHVTTCFRDNEESKD